MFALNCNWPVYQVVIHYDYCKQLTKGRRASSQNAERVYDIPSREQAWQRAKVSRPKGKRWLILECSHCFVGERKESFVSSDDATFIPFTALL